MEANEGGSEGNNKLVQRLTVKISEQAKELSHLYSELRQTKNLLETYQTSSSLTSLQQQQLQQFQQQQQNDNNYLTSSSKLSKVAQHKRIEKEHKEQLNSIERQLAISQHRSEETNKQKNQLIIENEKLKKEVKFYEKCSNDSQHEVQRLRVQLETLHRKLGMDGQHNNNNNGNNPSSTSTSTGRSLNLFEEMKILKNEFKSCESERNSLRDENNELTLKVKVLEDALEFRANEIGLAGHADLLTKISYLKGEISALKKDLTNKTRTVENLQTERSNCLTGQESLKQQVDELQHRLTETKHELYRSKQLLDIPIPLNEEMSNLNQINSSKLESLINRNHSSASQTESTSPTVIINALDQIKSLEQERDLLIEFIQTDMQKSSELLTEISELKIQNKHLTEENDKLNRQRSSIEEKNEKIERKFEKLNQEYIEVERTLREIERERNEFKILSEKRIEEIEELYEGQTKSTNQLSDFQKSIDKLERENRQLKADNHEKTMNLTIQTKDAEMWKGRYQELEGQYYNVNNELQEFKPKTRGLESEFKRLYSDHDKLIKERDELIENLNGFREYHEIKSEIDSELESILPTIKQKDFSIDSDNEVINESGNSRGSKSSSQQLRNTPKKMNKKSTPQQNNNSNNNKLIVRNVVEKHGLWCGLHAIKTFHPLMSEFIRTLYQDLHDTFQELKKLQEKYERVEELNEEYSNKLQHYEQDSMEYQIKSNQFQSTERKIEEKEREWNRFNEEIRYVIMSAVQLMENENKNKFHWKQFESNEMTTEPINKQSYSQLRQHQSQSQQKKNGNKYQRQQADDEPYELYEPIESERSSESGHENDFQQSHYQSRQTQRDYNKLRDDEIRLDDLIADIQPSSGNSSPSFKQRQPSTQPSLMDSLQQISSKNLPSFLSKLLIHNITLANNFQQLQVNYSELQQTNLILLQKNSSTFAMNSNLQETLKHNQQRVEQMNQTYNFNEEELKNQTIEATELAEKQNSLIVTLEAKLTEMRRKLLLKGSQITSLQQREITMQKKLYGTLKTVYEQLSIHFTSNLPLPSVATSFSTTISADSIPSLPELLNLTQSCFDDIIRWQSNLKLSSSAVNQNNKHQQIVNYSNENEDYNSDENNRRTARGGGGGGSGGYEEWLRRKPPTIPKR